MTSKTITTNDVPENWKQFLNILQKDLFPDAVIAGGALRDLWFENKISDVDIFMRENGMDTEYFDSLFSDFCPQGKVQVKQILDRDDVLNGEVDRLGEMCTKYVESFEDGAESMDEEYSQMLIQSFHRAMIESWIGKVFNITVTDENGVETVFQLITVNKDPLEYISTEFDFGICKIVFDGQSVFWDDHFEHDVENKQMSIRMTLTKSSLWRSAQHHFVKLSKKFPGWPMVIHEFKSRGASGFPPIDSERIQRFKDKIDETSNKRADAYVNAKHKKAKTIPVDDDTWGY